MIPPPRIRTLPWSAGPLEVAAAWPADQPLFMLHSADVHERWGRWSILATPAVIYRFGPPPACSRWIGSAPGAPGVPGELASVKFTHDPLRDLDAILAATRLSETMSPREIPFCGGWIGYLSYDLGRWIEPAVEGPATRGDSLTPALSQGERGGIRAEIENDAWPLIELGWCPWALVHDARRDEWMSVGDVPAWVAGRGQGASDVIFRAGALQPATSPDEYLAAVERTIEYIRAGDIFQANIAQRFSAPFSGSVRGFAMHALRTSGARYGALLEFPGAGAGDRRGRSLVSLSPELFLQVDARTRIVTTRPIKGTRPGGGDPDELLASDKDAAELHMIVDLMRNDLGRVCEFSSVRVPHPRLIESYPTVHHGVAEVSGRLRPGISTGDLLRAAFPGGSVTGAPKIRAMQIIDELEPARRGPYCGAIGFFSDSGDLRLNIAIRTAMLHGRRAPGRFDVLDGTLDYWAGCGIVADSDPMGEYQESLDKAAVLRLALEQHIATTR